MRSYKHVRNAVTLGTSLTALFLLVRCTVQDRDYADLNIGNAGRGGSSGSGGGSGGGGGGVGGTTAGQGGGGGQGGSSGQGGDAGTTIEPIPCDAVDEDAGTGGAATSDAGLTDGGSGDAACACVDGFIQAVDADGDGEGTRACSIAPGLDCDDGEAAVTHNGCGGCTELSNELGADCLECGAYACKGPDAVSCATKPDAVVVDPDCRCQSALIVARDTDGDGEGTRLCDENPGNDCNDSDSSFVTNACGGCDMVTGSVGADCNDCGTLTCSGTLPVCVPKAGAGGQQCLNETTRQTCGGNGDWTTTTTCPNVCYEGNCENCLPGTFRCVATGDGTDLERCFSNGEGDFVWSSSVTCTSSQMCNAADGECQGHFLLPRDRTFDVVPLHRDNLPWHELLNTASDSDYG